jgi:hypothetical protein
MVQGWWFNVLLSVREQRATDADLSDVPDSTIERWAGWRGQRGTFAPLFRAEFCTDGVVSGWDERQAPLITRLEKDAARKVRERAAAKAVTEPASTDRPRTIQGRSTDRPDPQYSTVQISIQPSSHTHMGADAENEQGATAPECVDQGLWDSVLQDPEGQVGVGVEGVAGDDRYGTPIPSPASR